MMKTEDKVVAQSKIQLASAYNVTLKIFGSWIEPLKNEIGEYRGKTYTPKQVRIIYDYLGYP
jgi:hypothetical protein